MRAVMVVFLLVVAVVEGWAIGARDPDFWLPDPFHGLVLAASLLFALGVAVPWKAAQRALCTLALAAPALLLLGELYAQRRDAGDRNTRIVLSPDPLLRFHYRPGSTPHVYPGHRSITITPDGLWDLPHQLPKPPDVLRVAVLGDSVPNDPMIDFPQRFPHRIEAMLADQAPAGKRVEVINVSCEGFNTQQQVRLLETVGLKYQPDLVIVAFVLNDPFLQHGAHRRVGNSYFTFQLAPVFSLVQGSICPAMAQMHQGYAYELVVRDALERLRLHAQRDGFGVLVAPLPIVERFDDPVCSGLFDKVIGVGRELGFSGVRVVDAFRGEDHLSYAKPGQRWDVTHPSAAAHERIARAIASAAAPMLAARAGQP